MGAVSSVGLGKVAFFDALSAGTTGISRVTSFDTESLGRHFAGEVKGFDAKDHLTPAELRRTGRCSAMALASARMAMTDARLEPNDIKGPRTAVVLGTTMGEAGVISDLDRRWILQGPTGVKRALLPKYGSTLLPIHVARAVGAEGMVLTLPAACAAGNYAIGMGSDLIRSGRYDVVITGASEVLQQLQFSGFVRLAAMAAERVQPFDLNRQGLLLGEGAAVLILESEAHAVKRGATALAEVGGYGLTCDAYHITRPHPDAEGSTDAMRQSIRNSGLTPNDVDFVNAHGTGTRANDPAEARVMHQVFGEKRVPLSSIKSMLGHCMGAASALEAVACVMTVERGVYPPTINFETPDPECDVELVANEKLEGASNVVLNNSLAFGGYNAVTCFARPGVLPEPPSRAALKAERESQSELPE